VRAIDGWRAFWFYPQPAYTLGLVRIVFGVITIGWTLSLLLDLQSFFSSTGVLPREPENPFEFGLFEFWNDDRALLVAWTALLIAAVTLTMGWHSRLSALLVWTLVMSFEYRNPFIFNSGDSLLRIEALFLALAPCGAALSLDQRRRTGSFWSAQWRAPWPLRLMQIQLTIVYLSTFVARMGGEKWLEGTALSYALRLEDMLIIPIPQWISMNPLLINVASWGTMILEVLIGILIWSRPWRRWVVVAGVVLHCAIMVTIGVGFFTPAMFVLYLAFVAPESVRCMPDTAKRFISRLRRVGNRRRAADVHPVSTDASASSIGAEARTQELIT
jgi:hypothetical protein